MSLFNPSNPKNACHIQRLNDATTSKTIVGSRIWPECWPFHAAEQFFHFQCMQSMLPGIPRNPRLSPLAKSLAMSSLFGDLKYSLKKISTIVLTNFFKLFIAVDSPIHTYSSIKLAVTSYASIISAAVIFWREDKPSLWALSLFWIK